MYPQGVCRIRKPACAGNSCAIFQVFKLQYWDKRSADVRRCNCAVLPKKICPKRSQDPLGQLHFGKWVVSARAALHTLSGSLHFCGAAPKIKNAAEKPAAYFIARESDGALNLVGAEASGTSVHMAGSSVNDSLNALDVGLPCTIGTSVGVRDLDTEGYALATKITLSHFIAPPIF